MEQLVNEIFKPVHKNNQFRKVVALYVNQIWSMDIVFMTDEVMVEQNNEYKYILFCIDIYSRYGFARPMKTKTSKEVLNNIISIVNEAGETPRKFYVDEGSEFYNKLISEYCLDNGITIYSTHGGQYKASIVERFNRTIKTNLYKKMLVNHNWKWMNILPGIIKEYNLKPHRGIDNKVPLHIYQMTDHIEPQYNTYPVLKPKFKIGDRVRIPYLKAKFDKSYFPNWTYEIFTIHEVKYTYPITYILKDSNNEIIKGPFYEKELLKTNQKDDILLIEKILAEKINKKTKKITHYLVKWLGYSDPTWELAKNVEGNFEDQIMDTEK